ncbi:UBAP1-MVB12-associated (UMA)-domain containing protein 1 isoform 3-T3 [Molossus nigricans]
MNKDSKMRHSRVVHNLIYHACGCNHVGASGRTWELAALVIRARRKKFQVWMVGDTTNEQRGTARGKASEVEGGQLLAGTDFLAAVKPLFQESMERIRRSASRLTSPSSLGPFSWRCEKRKSELFFSFLRKTGKQTAQGGGNRGKEEEREQILKKIMSQNLK